MAPAGAGWLWGGGRRRLVGHVTECSTVCAVPPIPARLVWHLQLLRERRAIATTAPGIVARHNWRHEDWHDNRPNHVCAGGAEEQRQTSAEASAGDSGVWGMPPTDRPQHL